MSKFKITLPGGKETYVEEGATFYDIIKENNIKRESPIVLASLNGDIHELTHKVNSEGDFDVIDVSTEAGSIIYRRTLQFVLIKAALDIYPNSKIVIEHTLGKGLFGEIHKGSPLNEADVKKIRARMQEIIDKDIKINKIMITKEEGTKIFQEYGMEDKVRLLNYVGVDKFKIYELDGRYDYFYGGMAYSTGILKVFDLEYYEPGFILRFPSEKDPNVLPEFKDQNKLSKIFYETEQWGNILGVGDVGSLNDKVVNGEISTMIRVSEALHEKKIAYIADTIYENRDAKIVLIAGPSSSGKTTFSKRLGIQLRVNGLVPIPISLDDYFVDRDLNPKDENGDYDFESIYALDLKLFNENLRDLMLGKEVEIPSFNFKKGSREWTGEKISVPENGIVIIEGIHGLNEMLTSSIPRENKFKIYISALTQLNLDNHNRISTTDVRIIRRIVRDYLSRGYGGEETLKMWNSIKKGEEKNIFVFQEDADVMFNSTLVYELCLLKKYALAELEKISIDSPVYYQAFRLRSFLNFFKDIDLELVPDNSILREFVGGSYFYKY